MNECNKKINALCISYRFGIRVNTVLAGIINDSTITVIPDNMKETFKDNISLQRFGKLQEVAEVIAFLASDRSSYVNGTSIEVSGGLY